MERYCVIGCDVDLMNDMEEQNQPLLGYVSPNSRKVDFEHLGGESELFELVKNKVSLVLAIDNILDRARLIANFGDYLTLYVSKSATVSRLANLGKGVAVYPNAYISSGVRINSFSKISIGSQIHHEVNIGQNAVIAPSVTLLGRVDVGDGTFIGAGAVVAPGVSVGSGSTIGMMSLVNRDIATNTRAWGIPARDIPV